MDILRQLTRKFRAQDISDRSSLSSSSAVSHHMNKEDDDDDDDVVDSGTASDDEDEEVAGIFLPQSAAVKEDTLDGRDELSEDPGDLDSRSQPNPNPSTAWNALSTSAAQHCHLTAYNFLSTSSSLLPSFDRHMDDTLPVAAAAPAADGRHSVTSSDYERCSLDFEASSSSEPELHSSEEELAAINRDEKRKRSQLSDDSSVFSDDEDDEVHELFRGQDELLFHSLSVRLAKAPGPPNSAPEMGLASGQQGISPQKRHRRDCCGLSLLTHHRPSLDFYKMQKTCIIRKHQRTLVKRPRLVKLLWIMNKSQRPSMMTFDPSPFCFRSLSWTPMNMDNDSPHMTR